MARYNSLGEAFSQALQNFAPAYLNYKLGQRDRTDKLERENRDFEANQRNQAAEDEKWARLFGRQDQWHTEEAAAKAQSDRLKFETEDRNRMMDFETDQMRERNTERRHQENINAKNINPINSLNELAADAAKRGDFSLAAKIMGLTRNPNEGQGFGGLPSGLADVITRNQPEDYTKGTPSRFPTAAEMYGRFATLDSVNNMIGQRGGNVPLGGGADTTQTYQPKNEDEAELMRRGYRKTPNGWKK